MSKKSKILEVGKKAPDFSLYATPDQKVSLSEFKGHKVMLIFYPADWSPVCTDELTIFNDLIKEFKKHDTAIIGISVDSSWSHIAFGKSEQFHIPLLSDSHPKGEVSKKYGTYDDTVGACERALFLIDEEGFIIWNSLSPVGVNPGAEDALEFLSLKKQAS